MNIKRFHENPLIKPSDVKPYHPDHEVIGVFNAGVATYKGETLLLLRIAERPINHNPNTVKVSFIDFENRDGQLTVVELDKNDRRYDFSDPRSIYFHDPRRIAYLTSLSYIRIARSKDGKYFEIDDKPLIYPENEQESWGMEDPRVTQIGDTYYIQYSSISPNGIGVGLISTKDFIQFKRLGMMLHPQNKDVAIFPEKINGKYYALHRPVPKDIGTPDIWLAESDNLIYWGNHQFLYGVNENSWENGRVGGGAVPIRTEKGWLAIYHAADRNDRYCLGALLLDLNDPSKILAKTDEPILEPEAPYEKEGFFGNVVFTCGVTKDGDDLTIYYGAADEYIAGATVSLEEIMSNLNYR
ncbi:glycoside hydrolase family 130 protein [Fervidibacillus halotolerans]|uniref:Glycoside hydrolase family 130 protein n=1 Tax=Fervidibacillus halotolerans TaxID=2980027 RepID=A0A9E8M0L3_9BACI|nr:glycoside hydrolase family 130 protein [Fervidibacillus halotolerans]WAA13167.1 glycoside hydrolase family 130 protein [Fervidibacillus halotolerans]